MLLLVVVGKEVGGSQLTRLVKGWDRRDRAAV
jgi:hypothetical protein